MGGPAGAGALPHHPADPTLSTRAHVGLLFDCQGALYYFLLVWKYGFKSLLVTSCIIDKYSLKHPLIGVVVLPPNRCKPFGLNLVQLKQITPKSLLARSHLTPTTAGAGGASAISHRPDSCADGRCIPTSCPRPSPSIVKTSGMPGSARRAARRETEWFRHRRGVSGCHSVTAWAGAG